MSYRFEDNTPQFFDSVRSAADSAINDMANTAFNKLKSASSFSDDTGMLRNSIIKHPSKMGREGGWVLSAGEGPIQSLHPPGKSGHKKKLYPKYIEYGNKTRAPKPYMRPLRDKLRKDTAVLVSALKRVVK